MDQKDKTEVAIKKKEKKGIILPKNKPLVVKKQKSTVQKKSKYFKKRDFDIAKKAIKAMEKGQWIQALSISKKTRDKSIYNFVKWRYLLTTGNKANFNDYDSFIRFNNNYPRIGRLRYLAEHKISSSNVSSSRILNWFKETKPVSGFGNLMLGESLISKGEIEKGIKLMKRIILIIVTFFVLASCGVKSDPEYKSRGNYINNIYSFNSLPIKGAV